MAAGAPDPTFPLLVDLHDNLALSSLVKMHSFDSDRRQRTERFLAPVRALFATVALASVYLDPTEQAGHARLAHWFLAVYLAFSIAVLGFVRRDRRLSPRFGAAVHAGDVLAAALVLLTEGARSPFFGLSGFVLLATAHRWGLRETVGTGVVIAALFAIEAYSLNRFSLAAASLMLLAVAVGYIAAEEGNHRAEMAGLGRVLARAQQAGTFFASLRIMADELLRIFGARTVCLVLEESTTGRVFLWEGSRATDSGETVLRTTELDAPENEVYTLTAPTADCLVVRRPGSRVELLVPNAARRRLIRHPVQPPAAFLATETFDRALSVAQTLGEDWKSRLFVFDPELGHRPGRALAMLARLTRQLGPVAYHGYLAADRVDRARVSERARVGREIHDGVLQSLIGLKMQLEVLRSRADGDSNLSADIERIENLMQREILNMRTLMFELAPTVDQPNHLPVMLADLVERFERESGISTEFITDLDDAKASAEYCHEIGRILKEALVNVQKHSGARNVLVRLSTSSGCWVLVVDDDGRGFDFGGRLSHDVLDRTRRGPRVIKERLRLLDGSLVIESTPGEGARLEITIPQRRSINHQ